MRESYQIAEILSTGERGVIVSEQLYYAVIRLSNVGHTWEVIVDNDDFVVLHEIEFEHIEDEQ